MIYNKLNLVDGDTVDEKVFQHIDNSLKEVSDSASNEYSIHISFDDIYYCLITLSKNSYTSIFDEPFLGWLKGLHDQYGAKFSLYVYDLSYFAKVPDTYKKELFDARHWLKFGLHSKSSGFNYASETATTNAAADWKSLVDNVVRITGTHESVDRIPRLHNFAGSLPAVQGMRDADCGIIGFLGSDDTRVSYHLTSDQQKILAKESTFLDTTNGVIIFRTNYRGEWLAAVDGMYEKMETFFTDKTYANHFKPFVWFTHESYVYKGAGMLDKKKNVEDVCKFAYDYHIPFTYPQNQLKVNPKWFMS